MPDAQRSVSCRLTHEHSFHFLPLAWSDDVEHLLDVLIIVVNVGRHVAAQTEGRAAEDEEGDFGPTDFHVLTSVCIIALEGG